MTRSVVVTGTSSFVGCHVARAFAEAGDAVTATHSRPRATYDGIRAERLAFAGEHAALAQLDITDAAAVAALAARVKPDLWVHHAGYATRYAGPDYDMAAAAAVNVQPLDAIYAAMAETGGGVIITGSNAEYADGPEPDREDADGEPATPYGRAKLAETQRARDLSTRYGVPTRVGRLYIPFGRFDNPAKLLSETVAALRGGRPVDLSPCTQKRDFLGVGDVSRAWRALADDLATGGFDIVNVCSGQATELKTLLLAIADALGADPALLTFGAKPMRPGEPDISFGDNAKMRRLGWTPRPLARALREDLLDEAAPKVTVLLSVLNGEAYLREAIDSVLNQTFGDFEFLILDNASTDGTADIISGYDDTRIVYVRNPETLTLTQSLNKGLGLARGTYVARLDADDIALPNRLDRQIAFLDAHPDVALVAAGWTDFFGTDTAHQVPGPLPPAEHDALLAALAERNVLAHSSLMFRRQAVRDVGGYPAGFAYAMEYALYFALAERHRLASLPEPLVAMRNHAGQETNRLARRISHLKEEFHIAASAARSTALVAAVRRRARRQQVRTAMRLGLVTAQGGQVPAALGWIARGFLAGPGAFMCLAACAAIGRGARHA